MLSADTFERARAGGNIRVLVSQNFRRLERARSTQLRFDM